MFKKSIKFLMIVFLFLSLMVIQKAPIFANYSGVQGDISGKNSGGGIPTNRDDFVIPYPNAKLQHGMRVYFVKDEGGPRPKLVSKVKDLIPNNPYSNVVWSEVTRFSINTTNNTLGTRWDFSYSSFSANTYENFEIRGDVISTKYGVSVPTITQTDTNAVKNFFTSLANRTASACGILNDEYPSCLHKFLIEDLEVDNDIEQKLRDNIDLDDYYIVIEPVFRYQWVTVHGTSQGCVGEYLAGPANLQTYRCPRNTWALTAKEGHDIGNMAQIDETSRGVPWYLTSWRWVFSRLYHHAPLSIMNDNPSGTAGTVQQNRLSQLDTRPSVLNPDLSNPWNNWEPQAASDLGNNAYTDVFHSFNPAVNNYRPGIDLNTRSGLGIGYLWFGQFAGEEDCETWIEQALDGTPLSPGFRPDRYVNFINAYITDRTCCPEFGAEINDTSPGEHRDVLQEDYNLHCTEPEENGEEIDCDYWIDVSCPDCVLEEADRGVVSDMASADSANVDEEWECIFASETAAPTAPFNFQTHYIQESAGNRYCKIFCREDLRYEYPSNDLVVPAGFHFTIGNIETAIFTGEEVPHWGPVEFEGSVDCRPTLKRDKEADPLDDDHDDLFIDHILFVEQWKKADEDVGIAYDNFQTAALSVWAIENARYTSTSANCDYFFQDSYSGENGCIREELMYNCPSGTNASDGGLNRRNTAFDCESVINATASCSHHNVPGTYWNGDRCVIFLNDVGIEQDVGAPQYSCNNPYTLSGDTCYFETPAVADNDWNCTTTRLTRLREIDSAIYQYSDPNVIDAYFNQSYTWCAEVGDLKVGYYSWEDASSGGVTRREIQDQLGRTDNNIPTGVDAYKDVQEAAQVVSALNSATGAENSARSNYHAAVARRDALLSKIWACQEFEYNEGNLEPELEVTYDDYKYPEPEYYTLESSVDEEDWIKYYVQREEQAASSIAEIDYFECENNVDPVAHEITAGELADGDDCPILKEEYPDNDSWFYNKLRTVTYTLNEDVYAYVEKADNRATFDTNDSISHHEPPHGSHNYIRIPYGNFPIHYYQGENAVPVDGVLTSEIKMRFTDPESFGVGHRFNEYVFDLNNVPVDDCFDYECEFDIIYLFPSPDPERLDMFVQFRPIDLSEPFPGFSGGGRQRGRNWENPHIVDMFITNNRNVETKNLYLEKEPLYVIELGVAEIRQVRDYNQTVPYNLSELICEEDTERNLGFHRNCKSSFVDHFAFVERANCLNAGFDACD